MHEDGLQRLEQRLSRVEQEIEALKSSIVCAQHPWWERTAGIFKDDPMFENLMRQVRRLRREDYTNTRSASANAVANVRPSRKAPRKRRAS